MKPKHYLILIILLAVGLRLIAINQSLWLDEAINVLAARNKTPIELVTKYSLGDFHPPLYHLVLYTWIKLVGSSEVAVRLPSVLLGIGSVIFTFGIGQFVFDNKKLKFGKHKLPLMVLPALLLATSGLQIYYSQEARMYALAAFGIAGAVYFWFRQQQKPKRRNLILFAICLWIALMSDYVPWLLLPVFIVYQPVFSVLALLATCMWWPYFLEQLQIGLHTASDYPLWGKVVGGLSLKNIALIPIKFIWGRITVANKAIYAAIAGTSVLVNLGLLVAAVRPLKKTYHNKAHLLLWLWLLVPIGLGIVMSVKISLLSYFRFIFVLPALYLLLILGVEKIKKLRWQQAAVIFLIAVNLVSAAAYLFLPQFHRENWREGVEWMESAAAGDEALALIPNLAQGAPYLYYQDHIQIADSMPSGQLPNTIYLIRYVQEIFDPEDSLRHELEQSGYKKVDERNFNGVLIWQYQRQSKVFASLPLLR